MKKLQITMFALFVGLFVMMFSSSTAQAQCKDPWINQAVKEIVGRAPLGSQLSGECDIQRYGNGSWSNYDDLKRKVWKRFGSEITATYEDESWRRLCLDTTSRNAGTKIVAHDCHGGESQQFILRTDGTIRLFNEGLCLDGKNGEGRDLIFDNCNGNRTQRWYVNRVSTADNIPKTWQESENRRFEESKGQIQNEANNSCIDIKGGSLNSKEIVLWKCDLKKLNRSWNQIFAAAPIVQSGKAYVFKRHYNPVYQGHTGWAFSLADGRWIFGAIDGTQGMTVKEGENNGWFMTIFDSERKMLDYVGGFSVSGQNPAIMRFGPYTSFKSYDIYNAHPATAIQVAVRSKDWGYGVARNNCVDTTVKVLRAYGVSIVHPGEKGTSWIPNTWFGQITGGKEGNLNYDKASARRNGCLECY